MTKWTNKEDQFAPVHINEQGENWQGETLVKGAKDEPKEAISEPKKPAE